MSIALEWSGTMNGSGPVCEGVDENKWREITRMLHQSFENKKYVLLKRKIGMVHHKIVSMIDTKDTHEQKCF